MNSIGADTIFCIHSIYQRQLLIELPHIDLPIQLVLFLDIYTSTLPLLIKSYGPKSPFPWRQINETEMKLIFVAAVFDEIVLFAMTWLISMRTRPILSLHGYCIPPRGSHDVTWLITWFSWDFLETLKDIGIGPPSQVNSPYYRYLLFTAE